MTKSNLPALKNYLEAKLPGLKALAVREFKPEALISIVLWDMQKIEKLSKCTHESILYCVKYGVQHGLEIGGTLGQLHMVPFGNVATPIVGYKGIVKLLVEGGSVKSVEARPVYENDGFRCDFVTDGFDFFHRPSMSEDRGPMIGVYAIFRGPDGKPLHIEVMTKAEVDKVRASSKAGNSGPWVTWYEEQAKKTAAKRGAKYIPIGSKAAMAIAEADEVEFGDGPIDADFEVVEETSTTDNLKNQLRANSAASPPSAIPQPAAEPTPEPEPVAPELPDENGHFPSDQIEPEPEPKPRPARKRKSQPKGDAIKELRRKINGVLPELDAPDGLIAEWANGKLMPSNWVWSENGTKEQLEELLKLVVEEAQLTT